MATKDTLIQFLGALADRETLDDYRDGNGKSKSKSKSKDEDEDSEASWAPKYPEIESSSSTSLESNTESYILHHTTSSATTAVLDDDPTTQPVKDPNMSQQLEQIVQNLSEIDGFIAASVASTESGMSLASKASDSSFDVEIAAALNTDVVRAKHAAMRSLHLEGDNIDDILITLTSQYHLIRPSTKNPQIFIYLALDRSRANLAFARHQLAKVEDALDI